MLSHLDSGSYLEALVTFTVRGGSASVSAQAAPLTQPPPHPAVYSCLFLLTCTCRAPRSPVAASLIASPGPGVRGKSPLLVSLRCNSLASCSDTVLSGTAGLPARVLSPRPLMPLSMCGSRPGSDACCALGKESPTCHLTLAGSCGACTALGCFTYTSDPGPRRFRERPGVWPVTATVVPVKQEARCPFQGA